MAQRPRLGSRIRARIKCSRFSRLSDLLEQSLFDGCLVGLRTGLWGLDSFGNPIVAEALTNRLSFYYPTVEYTTSAGGVAGRQSGNSSNYFGRFAPTMLGSIFAFPNSSFGNQTASFSGLPIFTRLGGVQVLVGGARAVCLAWADQLPGPWATPTGGLEEFQVVRIHGSSSGELVVPSGRGLRPGC